MSTRRIAALILIVLAGACGSPAADRAAATQDRTAVWRFDDDENIAYPTCPRCGADVDRGVAACGACGGRMHIASETIKCPECTGSKECVRCGAGCPCLACDGGGTCPICDGTGKWRDGACPECDGADKCGACAPGASATPCARCDDTHVCSNCEGTGLIELK